MNTDRRTITVSGTQVSVVRKRIKNLHLGVYPPDGRVRVAAPLAVSDSAVRLAVVGKLGWVKRQQAKFMMQPRQSEREFVTGESHYFQGRRYRLNVVVDDSRPHVSIRGTRTIQLSIREAAGATQRERLFLAWYRAQLKALGQPLIERWEAAMGVTVADWGVKQMKTKWGSCNVDARRIWLNLQLAKKPAHCVEYIVVHELAHLIERHHTQRFTAVLDQFLPRWRSYREELGAAPLEHEEWGL